MADTDFHLGEAVPTAAAAEAEANEAEVESLLTDAKAIVALLESPDRSDAGLVTTKAATNAAASALVTATS